MKLYDFLKLGWAQYHSRVNFQSMYRREVMEKSSQFSCDEQKQPLVYTGLGEVPVLEVKSSSFFFLLRTGLNKHKLGKKLPHWSVRVS